MKRGNSDKKEFYKRKKHLKVNSINGLLHSLHFNFTNELNNSLSISLPTSALSFNVIHVKSIAHTFYESACHTQVDYSLCVFLSLYDLSWKAILNVEKIWMTIGSTLIWTLTWVINLLHHPCHDMTCKKLQKLHNY